MITTHRFTQGLALLFMLSAILLGHLPAAPLSVRTLGMEKGEMPEWHVRVAEDKFEKLSWPERQPSVQLAIEVAEHLQLFEKLTNEEGEIVFKEALKVEIPNSAHEVLLLGSPAGEEVLAAVIAIEDFFKKAKFNDWLVINQSEQTVSLRFGKDNEPIKLAAGKSGIYKIQGEQGKGGAATAEANIRDKMQKIYSTFWSAPAEQRSLVIFYNDDGRPKLRRINDLLPEKAE